MACIFPEGKESLLLQQKIWAVMEHIQDHAKAWLFGWIIFAGLISAMSNDVNLVWLLAGIPVFLVMGLAVLVVALSFIWGVLRFFF